MKNPVNKNLQKISKPVTTPEDIFPEFPERPESWMGEQKDLAYGQALLPPLRAFVTSLIASGLTRKTIRRHMGNLWLLGGEIIREVNDDNQYRYPPLKKLRESIDEEGGPYCRHLDSEEEMRSFDST